jgi:dTMP kinase
MTRGRLIAMCGIDGCGKTTQIGLLAGALRARGIDVVETRQPTEFYRDHPQVRAYLDDGDTSLGMVGLALLAAADRQHHVRGVIEPALAAGRWVITDRYVYSTYAFFVARGLELDFLRTINRDVPRPDLSVLLDLPAEVARQRVQLRDGKALKYEERSLAFMTGVRDGFLAYRDASFLTVDATAPAAAIAAEIHARVGHLGPLAATGPCEAPG